MKKPIDKFTPFKRLQSLFHPDRYHGWGRQKRYFEGWYYKLISRDEQHTMEPNYRFRPPITSF